MKYVFIIFRREILKILTSWKKTVALFVIPAIVMVCALNLFPQLIKYLTTGTLGRQKVYVINAPQSFLDFPGKNEDLFKYEYMEGFHPTEKMAFYDMAESVNKRLQTGELVVLFRTLDADDTTNDFDLMVKDYFDTNAGLESLIDIEYSSFAAVEVFADSTNFSSFEKGYQLREDVLEKYSEYLIDTIGSSSNDSDSNVKITIDEFNPITLVLDHRSNANIISSHVVPGIIVLLMYYCVYSLSSDMFAMEKSRGFLAKLQMTPVPMGRILLGKILAIDLLTSISALCTFAFLFLSSWLNRSNDATSLLPFGMLLMPNQLLYMLLTVPATGFVMGAFCFKIIADLDKHKDIISNLQLPLVLLLVDFFIQMFTDSFTLGFEYIIPFHNTTVFIRDIFNNQDTIWGLITVIVVDLIAGTLLLKSCLKKMEVSSK